MIPCLIKSAIPDLPRADREVVLAAVAQRGDALECASDELKADREFILAAVAQDGEALFSASDELKADSWTGCMAIFMRTVQKS